MEYNFGTKVNPGETSHLKLAPTDENVNAHDDGLFSPKMKVPTSAPAKANWDPFDPSRSRSASVVGFDGEADRFQGARTQDPKPHNPVLSVEDRLFFLEKEYLKLLATNRYSLSLDTNFL